MGKDLYEIKQTVLIGLVFGSDLVSAIEAVCFEKGIRMGTFSVIGAVTSAAFGYYEQQQKRYTKLVKEGAFEIISCTGNVSLKENAPLVHAHILFGDEYGNSFGGHLMSPTSIFAAELFLQELDGEHKVREYDATTGLFLWK
jgi:hypothetical protein